MHERPPHSTSLETLGAGGMDFLAVEFVGETIENSTLADRITLCSMVTEMSGKSSYHYA